MAKTYTIRQAIFDWQGATPCVTLNVLTTDDDGDVTAKMERFEGGPVTAAAGQLEAFLLARAAIKWPGKTVAFPVLPPEVP